MVPAVKHATPPPVRLIVTEDAKDSEPLVVLIVVPGESVTDVSPEGLNDLAPIL
jgi:hypothetical protein